MTAAVRIIIKIIKAVSINCIVPQPRIGTTLTKITEHGSPITTQQILCSQVRDMIVAFGGSVKFTGSHSVQINAKTLTQAPLEQVEAFSGRSRIPILTCGPMLARTGHVIVPALGGCQIGDRPVDFHIEALKALGARVEAHETHIEIFADRLRGTKIRLPYPSVGATEQVLLASVLADGITELSNAAVEPEIMDLIAVLQKMGAIISVDTHRVITVHGVEKLSGFKHKALPDRLEAASWAKARESGKLKTVGRYYVMQDGDVVKIKILVERKSKLLRTSFKNSKPSIFGILISTIIS